MKKFMVMSNLKKKKKELKSHCNCKTLTGQP